MAAKLLLGSQQCFKKSCF